VRLGLDIGRSLAISTDIATDNILELALAGGKLAVLVGGRHVVQTPEEIITVLAVVWLSNGRVAELHAELATTNKVVPLNGLLVSLVVAGREAGWVDETTKRVASKVSTVRIELSSSVCVVETNTGLLDTTGNLDVRAGTHELDTGKGALLDTAGAVAVLGAVRDDSGLNVTDDIALLGRTPEAEIVKRVDNEGLALRLVTLGGGVATVVTRLRATVNRVRVDLVG
jgi:hypothetical protein